MRHLGWLHAIPEGSKKSRLTSFKDRDEDSSFLTLPELEEGGEYLIALLHEAGLMSGTGMGVLPLSWQEINAWLSVTELELTTWEKLLIKEMSEVYVSELNRATVPSAPAPYTVVTEPDEIDRAAVSDKVGSVLRGFKRKQT